jgi:hypothetical protein
VSLVRRINLDVYQRTVSVVAVGVDSVCVVAVIIRTSLAMPRDRQRKLTVDEGKDILYVAFVCLPVLFCSNHVFLLLPTFVDSHIKFS